MTEEVLINGDKSPQKAPEADHKQPASDLNCNQTATESASPVETPKANGQVKEAVKTVDDFGFDLSTLFQLSHKFFKGKHWPVIS